MAQDGFVVDNQNQVSLINKTAVSRNWILLDSNGQGTILDLDKYAIMRRVPINARDLRILDPLLSYFGFADAIMSMFIFFFVFSIGWDLGFRKWKLNLSFLS
ncbi:Magnesium transporter [Forsythia ovata]|uniref:Magnesium transporter n=1 Tax=Forsythia ovata TaxID=205694 RepID=A0ABD1WAK7_9LAMI